MKKITIIFMTLVCAIIFIMSYNIHKKKPSILYTVYVVDKMEGYNAWGETNVYIIRYSFDKEGNHLSSMNVVKEYYEGIDIGDTIVIRSL